MADLLAAGRTHRLRLGDGGDFRLDELPGQALPARFLEITYYDVDDRRLARAGLELRRFVEHGRSLWQLRVPPRTSWVQAPGGPARPPQLLADALAGVPRARPVLPVARVSTRRDAVRIVCGRTLVAEVMLDQVAIVEGASRLEQFAEVTVDVRVNGNGALSALERALRAAGAEPAPNLLGDHRVELADGATDGELLQAALRSQYFAVLANDPGVRLGDEPENVHQLRVALRRLRALLRVAASARAPDWVEPLRDELKWLGRELGRLRDAEVFAAELVDEIAKLDGTDLEPAGALADRLDVEAQTARASALAALGSQRYLDLLGALERAPALLPPLEELDLDKLAAAEFRRLRKAARRLGAAPGDRQLHEVRIKGKRARYTAELLAVRDRDADRFVRRAKRFQDVVGAHQDAVVAEERLRTLGHKAGPRAALAAGRLIERQRRRKERALGDFSKAWRRLERSGRRAFAA